jgi:NAD(P)-dependent dehydrogenase (short-subunit alcohol dehydrogenase family)
VSGPEDCPFRLDGKVAVVTGASRNVGLEIARTFAAAGAGVVMAAREAGRLRARAAEIRDQTGAAVLPVELAPAIRVNALVPGLTMSETGGPPAGPVADSLLAMVPMGRAGRPEEVARAALYLASDAASYTSGTALFVNGGRPW